MTTTKKKAKAPTLAQRVKALECDAEVGLLRVEISRILGQRDEARQNHVSAMAALERLAGSTEAADLLASGVDRLEQALRPADTMRAALVHIAKPGRCPNPSVCAQEALDGPDPNPFDDDAVPPAPTAPAEESRLRDAVVDAALAWGGPGWLGPSRMIDATAALRAHRAKGGA